MRVEYLYVVLCYCVLTSQCYRLKKELCGKTSCHYLYEAGNSYLTWDQAKAACNNEGLQMSKIESSQTQSIVNELLSNISRATLRQVWIGGRRSTDDTWYYINGTAFHGKDGISAENGETYPYCSHIKLCKSGDRKRYTSDNCDEKNSHARVLCQYDQPTTGKCESSDVLYGGKCYDTGLYESDGKDWYDAETYCSNKSVPGDVAYSYLDEDNSTRSIFNLLVGRNNCINLWLGIRRRAWYWTSDNHSISYFNWESEYKSSDGDCMYIDIDKQNKWMSQSCTDGPLQYFLCMNETVTRTISGMTTRITSTSETGNKFKSGYTAAIVVVLAVVLAVATGLTVFFVLKKRKRTSKDHCCVNDRLPSAKGEKGLDPEYADIDPVIGAGNSGNDHVRHMETPSGDLYALSTKQVNKPKGDLNKNNDVNARKKTRKPKAAGTKHTEHFEAPSGDVYAQVIK